ncbi:glycosyltransferase family 2 protein [Arenibacterium halophilum]|uniref:Glycosyltransferase family 2 protein n=1 Tax=Arenibacterium halophilum TaxID=2583821 RepID=A0ABY2XCB3_9RHOB|nr:glycosyltransferase family 2 protein [Arenibacterium halophilum]TMV13504.1 glycosyltransferase family 2 protein [Arenibacterium halophilum]
MRISIIIPTRERAIYLRHCLRTVLDIEDDGIEIIVSDNASVDSTADVLAQIHDPRVKVINTGKRVSMRENFEFSLSHATGDYVIYIGDDDAFIPGQFRVLRNALETHRPDSLSWSIPTYGWPIEGFIGKAGGVRFEKKFLFGALQEVDMARIRAKLLSADFEDFQAPTLYHGAASRSFMERHRAANGIFFNGSSPDLYYTDLAILKGARHFDLCHPITISGKSAASTGAASNSKSIKANAENPATRFARESNADQVRDLVNFGTSVRGNFFQILETVRDITKIPEQPDYASWFKFILADHKGHDANEQRDVTERLRAYAKQIDQTDTLNRVLADRVSDVSRRRLSARWEKAKSKLQSFRLSAEMEGENTVHTAARLADIILGDGYRPDGSANRDALWKGARQRSSPFKKQF